MTDFKKEYYENDEFWKPSVLGKRDKVRIEKTYTLLPKEIKNVLDVGCGNGLFCNYILEKKTKINITGIDRSDSALKHVLTNKAIGDITNIPFKDKEFDCVTSLQVIEHLTVDDYKKALNELVRVSNKYVLISVPLNEKIDKNVTKCPICKTIFNVDLHLRNYNNNDLQILFSDFNYSCISTTTTGSGKKYIGLNYLMKLKNHSHKLKNKFNAPICPVCGFKNVDFYIKTNAEKIGIVNNRVFFNLIKKTIFAFWPKIKTKDYWIIALYKRNDN
ncbi:MAG: class I SAM-dependent methyltransferase [Bacteroidales bacterium]|nr:class I SAM-dependent methyltransferase [Bacteroidales bacterium]